MSERDNDLVDDGENFEEGLHMSEDAEAPPLDDLDDADALVDADASGSEADADADTDASGPAEADREEADDSVMVFNHVSRWYGEVIALNDVSVAIKPGITGLLGPNGSGKSTFMQLAMGLLQPSQGEVRVLGERPWDNPKLLRRVGYVPEARAPWRDVSGLACATRAALLSGLHGADAESQAAAALARVGLTKAQDRIVGTYSHGMQQRLKLALALVANPRLLILDEPLLGTDPLARNELIRLLRDIAADGTSILLSTHVLPDVEALTENIVLLAHGRLMAHGTVSEIRDLLDRYPRTIRIQTPKPKDLGAALWTWDSVGSVESEEAAVVVRTGQPAAFFDQLQTFLEKTELPFSSVTSPDDNVDAVFRYLTR